MKKPFSTTIIAIVAMSSVAATAAPEEQGSVVRHVNWSEVPLPAGAVLQNKSGASPTILVKHEDTSAFHLPLWKLENPGITKKYYALRGRVRYQDVAGVGYFELWNNFPSEKPDGPKGRYFSRTLAEQGPFGQIAGSADWREVAIPFDASQSKTLPSALELSLHLPGAGEVEVTSLVLVEFDDAITMWAAIGVDAPAALRPPQEFVGKVIVGVLAVMGLALAGTVVWLVMRKSRQLAEERRMKAMDAMP